VLNMAGKKWYQPQLGMKYQHEYLQIRNDEARAQRWQGKTRTTQHVRFHQGFSGGSRSGQSGVGF